VRSWGLSAAEQDEVWRRWRRGQSLRLIARQLGKRVPSVRAFVLQTGGVQHHPPRRAQRSLSMTEREEISRGVAVGEPCRQIAARLGRAPSTVSRELARNGGRRRYRAQAADAAAFCRAQRPKAAKLGGRTAVAGGGGGPSWPCDGRRSRSPAGCRWPTSGSGDAGVARDDLPVAAHPEPRGAAPGAATLPAHRSGDALSTGQAAAAGTWAAARHPAHQSATPGGG
jgi:DNA-binding CsgD family transcriptional regulator